MGFAKMTRNACTLNVLGLVLALAATGFAGAAQATRLSITVENLAPQEGFFFTPVYGAFHDGGFDLFDVGALASPEFERLAEDGDFSFVRDARLAAFPNSQGFAVFGSAGPIAPGETVTLDVNINGASNRFLTLASMLIPSQDAFIGIDTSVELFDANGDFLGVFSRTFQPGDIYDAGTEDNTDNTQVAFLNQTGPDQGASEMNNIGLHPGLSDFILDSTSIGPTGVEFPFDRVAADFTQAGFGPVARVTIAKVSEPEGLLLMGVGILGLLGTTARRSRAAA